MTAAWTPDDALMTRAMEAFWDAPDGGNTAGVRAALIACRDDMVAEAVKAEAEACAATLDAMAESHQRAADAIADQGHMDVALGFRGASASASECAALIRARHP